MQRGGAQGAAAAGSCSQRTARARGPPNPLGGSLAEDGPVARCRLGSGGDDEPVSHQGLWTLGDRAWGGGVLTKPLGRIPANIVMQRWPWHREAGASLGREVTGAWSLPVMDSVAGWGQLQTRSGALPGVPQLLSPVLVESPVSSSVSTNHCHREPRLRVCSGAPSPQRW